MQIRKIQQIQSYKSFHDFSWVKFCKHRHQDKGKGIDELREDAFDRFVLIFGENGAGKSSVCDIFKNFSGSKEFVSPPSLVQLEFGQTTGDGLFEFKDNKWSPQPAEQPFTFFDVDFVNNNVHTHGNRENVKGKHSQNSGSLIIDLDEEANKLKSLVSEKKAELEKFALENSQILQKTFLEEEELLFAEYESLDQTKRGVEIDTLQKNVNELQPALTAVQKLSLESSRIVSINPVATISSGSKLSSKEQYLEIFQRSIKERSQEGADEAVKMHFEKHKSFIESAIKEIPESFHDAACPLCTQPLSNVVRIIEFYRVAFDKSYELEKQKLLQDVRNLKIELENIRPFLNALPAKVSVIFTSLEKLKSNFEIPNIYSVEEKGECTKKFDGVSSPLDAIDSLTTGLDSLCTPQRSALDVEALYSLIRARLTEAEALTASFNAFISEKNNLITAFKGKYSDASKIASDIQAKASAIRTHQSKITFLTNKTDESIRANREAQKKKNLLTGESKQSTEKLDQYLADAIPKKVIDRMIAILNQFNLDFQLKHTPNNHATKEYSFSFTVEDDKIEREFKDGLSDGERQLISISFFFATIENLPEQQKKILVFDDPVTSLDAPNLKILAELVHAQGDKFGQVIVFTHHPLFHKYLAKCVNPNPTKFGLLKNKDIFGGSFIFTETDFNLLEDLKQCAQEINDAAVKGNLAPEFIALKYGQLLRLAVERFIKNDILMWNKESDFSLIANGLKNGKSKLSKMTDDDLDVINLIYKYCNYSGLVHAEKENPSALAELTKQIKRFIEIFEKVNV